MEKLQNAIGFFDEKLAQLELLIEEERNKGRAAHKRKASKHLILGHARCIKALETQHTNVINMKVRPFSGGRERAKLTPTSDKPHGAADC